MSRSACGTDSGQDHCAKFSTLDRKAWRTIKLRAASFSYLVSRRLTSVVDDNGECQLTNEEQRTASIAVLLKGAESVYERRITVSASIPGCYDQSVMSTTINLSRCAVKL
jgi:hypothetical protein